jgi:ABC-type bacteriocin/lantibiotic exporter with double-glycine peptidase domain
MNNDQIKILGLHEIFKQRKIKKCGLITFFGLITSTGLNLLSPYILSYLIDALINTATSKILLYLSTYLVSLVVAQATSNYFYYTCNKLGLTICSSIQSKVVSAYLGAQDVPDEHANYFVDCLIGDINQIAQSFYNFIATGLSNLCMIVGLIIIFFSFDFMFGSIILLLFIGIMYRQKITFLGHIEDWVQAKNSQSLTQATLASGIASSPQLTHQTHITYFKNIIQGYANTWFNLHQYALIKSIHNWSILYGLTILSSGFGIWQLWQLNSHQHITIGALFMYLEYIKNIQTPLEDVSHLAIELHQISSGLKRISNRLETYAQSPKRDTHTWPTQPCSLRLENLGFTYNNDASDLIENLNMTCHANEIINIAGPSGCGKSTLFNIIYGYKNDYTGNIFINDINIKNFSTDARKQHIGYITQFNAPVGKNIFENIARYDPDITQEICLKNADTLGLSALITNLPLQLLTPIAENNHETRMLYLLSTLIRLSIQNTAILLIDEPLTAADNEMDEIFIQALCILAQNKTVLLVSHIDQIRHIAHTNINIAKFNKSFDA